MKRQYNISESLETELKDGIYSETLDYLGTTFVSYLKKGVIIFLLDENRACKIEHSGSYVSLLDVTNGNEYGMQCKEIFLSTQGQSDGRKILELLKSDVWTFDNFWDTFDTLHKDSISSNKYVTLGGVDIFAYNHSAITVHSIFGSFRVIPKRLSNIEITYSTMHTVYTIINMLMHNQVSSYMSNKAMSNYKVAATLLKAWRLKETDGYLPNADFNYSEFNPNIITLVLDGTDYNLAITDPKLKLKQ